MTINKLHKELGKLIKQGHSRRAICISKSTFAHALESDGCTVLEVKGLDIVTYPIIDDDGGFKELANGKEATKTDLVLYGNNT